MFFCSLCFHGNLFSFFKVLFYLHKRPVSELYASLVACQLHWFAYLLLLFCCLVHKYDDDDDAQNRLDPKYGILEHQENVLLASNHAAQYLS